MHALLSLVVLTAAPTVVDGYQLLAKSNREFDILKRNGQEWQLKGEQEVTPLEKPVVDIKNGYLRLKYSVGACDREQRTAALYVAKGGKTFLATALENQCIESSNSTIGFYELAGGSATDALDKSGALKTLTFKDFFDEKAPADVLREIEDDKPAMRLVYELPQQGTTVKVTVAVDEEPATGVDQSLGPRAKKLMAERSKYKLIELKWDVATGTFSVGSKQKR